MAEQHTQSLVDEAARFGPSEESGLGEFLTLGHVLTGIGAEQVPPIRLEDIHLIRHSFRPGVHDALQGPEDLTEERVREYTRSQGISTRRFPADPGRYWVILIADGQRRSRLYGTFENCGELIPERTALNRFWDLRPSSFLAPLVGRLRGGMGQSADLAQARDQRGEPACLGDSRPGQGSIPWVRPCSVDTP